MKSFTHVIQDPIGIHARPAGDLVKEIRNFSSSVRVSGNGKTADAKRLIQVMQLGIRQGQEVLVEIEGEDEEEAAAHIEDFMNENL